MGSSLQRPEAACMCMHGHAGHAIWPRTLVVKLRVMSAEDAMSQLWPWLKLSTKRRPLAVLPTAGEVRRNWLPMRGVSAPV